MAGASKLARLTLDGKEYNVFEASFESAKKTDDYNRVTAYATYANAKFTIEGKEDTTSIFEKFANSRNRFDAKLTLYKTDGDGQLVETEFRDCSMKSYATSYSSSDDTPYKITIILSPKTTSEGSAELTFDQNT